jgi:hypothetical protein
VTTIATAKAEETTAATVAETKVKVAKRFNSGNNNNNSCNISSNTNNSKS